MGRLVRKSDQIPDDLVKYDRERWERAALDDPKPGDVPVHMRAHALYRDALLASDIDEDAAHAIGAEQCVADLRRRLEAESGKVTP